MPPRKELTIKPPKRYAPLYMAKCPYRSILYHGGRAGGKSWEVARGLLIRAATIPGSRVACLREFQTSIRRSVHALLADQIHILGLSGYDVTNDEIRHKNGSLFTFHGMHRNIDNIKGLESYDVAWIEEGQSVSEESLRWLVPTLRKPGSFIVVTMNRYTALDPAWVRFQPGASPRACVEYVVYRDNRNLSKEILEEAEFDRMNRPVEYRHVWLGEPISQAAKSILSASSISDAMHGNRVYMPGPVRWGLDVARMGDDSTQLTKVEGNRVTAQHERRKSPLDQTVDWVRQYVNKADSIKVDDTGLGGGVTDYLRRYGYNVLPVNFGARAQDREHYDLTIDEMWFQFQGLQDEVILLKDTDLYEELTLRQYGYDKYGRKRVQSKDDFKRIIHRSPDKADSLLLAFYEPRLTVPTIRTL